ncbi:hypothetical protein QR680_004328 [Steinernema hermaphroditum]|uniref:RING-type domain-containing protein n=1 Tax=Steinernema hermaphroditum TaxID=289476 RepID=A0AA39HPE1_9BILA|nr:hypothetical protein QR680_004328 [Steinernema hermaphroditum]
MELLVEKTYNIPRLHNHFVVGDNKLYFPNYPGVRKRSNNELANVVNSWETCLGQYFAQKSASTSPTLTVYDLLLGQKIEDKEIRNFPQDGILSFDMISDGKGRIYLLHYLASHSSTNVYHRQMSTLISTSPTKMFCARSGRWFPLLVDDLQCGVLNPIFIHNEEIHVLRSKDYAPHIRKNSLKDWKCSEVPLLLHPPMNQRSAFHSIPCLVLVFKYTAVLVFYRMQSPPMRFCRLDLRSWEMVDFTEQLVATTGINLEMVEYVTQDEYCIYISRRFTDVDKELFKIRVIEKESPHQPTAPSAPEATDCEQPTRLECPICLETFRQPKIFTSCGHSLCHNCERKISVRDPIAKTKTIFCPICRSSSTLREDEDLPKNWSLQELVDKGRHKIEKPHDMTWTPCHECQEEKDIEKLFHCTSCSNLRSGEVLICGDCVTRKHREHIDMIKDVEIVTEESKSDLLGTYDKTIRELETFIKEANDRKTSLETRRLELEKRSISKGTANREHETLKTLQNAMKYFGDTAG